MRLIDMTMRWQAADEGRLPGYKGGLLRGALGYALRHRFCLQDFNQSCKRCDTRANCQYALFFEPVTTDSVGGDLLAGSGFSDAARPFVFDIQDFRRHFREGEGFAFSLRLLGMDSAILQVISDVFADMSLMGLGKSRIPGSFSINGVRVAHSGPSQLHITPNRIALGEILGESQAQMEIAEPAITLRFLTWTVLKANGEILHHFEKDVFAKAVLRRLRQLFALYGETDEYPLLMRFYENLLQAWRNVEVDYDHTEYKKWGRTSTRQRQTYEVEGFIGTVKLLQVPAVWLPLLEWLQWIHVGKGATFGLGALRVQYRRDGLSH